MLINLYKKLHQIPELAFNETRTKDLITKILTENGIEFEVYPSGIIAKIEIDPEFEYVAFRTELDALDICEQTNVDFSANENMHACGHDMHMSIILGLCLKVNEKKECLKNNVLFIFQSGEEKGNGSQKLISEVNWPNVSSFYAFHNSNVIDINCVGIQKGQINSHILDFEIEFNGKSSHVAQPYLGVDALNTAIMFVNSIKQLQPSNFGAHKQYLINFSNFKTNNAQNVICDHCVINGTIRIASLDIVDNVKKIFTKTLQNVATLNNCEFKLSTNELIALVNDENLHNNVMNLNLNTKELFVMSSGGDDFSNFRNIAPIYLMKIGSKWPDETYQNYPVHSNKFLPNYNGIDYGVKIGLKILGIN